MDFVAPSWTLVAARGIAALVFGFVAFLWPSLTLSALAMLFGAYTLVDGLLTVGVATGAVPSSHAWSFALEGLLGIAFGLAAMMWTRAAITLVVYGVGLWALATGALELLAARALRDFGGGARTLRIGGWLSLLLGIGVILAPYA